MKHHSPAKKSSRHFPPKPPFPTKKNLSLYSNHIAISISDRATHTTPAAPNPATSTFRTRERAATSHDLLSLSLPSTHEWIVVDPRLSARIS